MKNKKIITLFASTFLLTGCAGTADPIIDAHKNPEELTVLSGKFIKDSESFISVSHNAKGIIKDKTFKKGSLVLELNYSKGNFYNGYTFLMNETGDSYYFVGINLENNLVLNKVSNDVTTTLFESDFEVLDNQTRTYMIYFNDESKYLELGYENEYLASFENITCFGDKLGLYGGNKGTTFSSITTSEINILDNDASFYKTKNGEFNKFHSLRNNSITLNENKKINNGTIEVTMQLNGVVSDNGIVFSVEDNNKVSFWEQNVSYYFLFINISGNLHLGKVDNGRWSNVSIVPINNYNPKGAYKIKVVKCDNKIFAYLNDELMMACCDTNALTGSKWGLRSGARGIVYSNINASTIVPNVSDGNQNVFSGSFSKIDNVLVSEANKSLALFDGNIKNGTIETILSPGSTNDTGIIFRVSKPLNANIFYENEEGLSYYWFMYSKTGGITFAKYDNGLVTRLKDVYLPYGTSPLTSFKLKIVMNEGDIYCYLDDRLSVYYHDDNYLKGEYFGIKATKANCVITKPVINNITDVKTNKTLIFGHSYTEFWKSYKEDFVGYEDIGNVGLGGSIAIHWSDGYNEEIAVYKPDLGIYWIGINDLTMGISPADVNKSVTKLLLEIKTKVPNFEVALLGCNRCPARTNIRNQIHELNVLFQQLASENPWIHYIETEYLYCDQYGNELGKYFTDGLHPTHDGYLLAVEEINKVLKRG